MPDITIAQPPPSRSGPYTAATAGVGLLASAALILLTAGSLMHHPGLLTWSVLCGTVSLNLIVLLVGKRMIDDAVRRCAELVARDMEAFVIATATRVGEAVAEALREDDDDDQSVPRIYSGRN